MKTARIFLRWNSDLPREFRAKIISLAVFAIPLINMR